MAEADDMIKKYCNEIHKKRNQIIEDFAKAYCAHTHESPDRVVLIQQQGYDENGKLVFLFYFVKKQEKMFGNQTVDKI